MVFFHFFNEMTAGKIVGLALIVVALFTTIFTSWLVKVFKVPEEKEQKAMLGIKLGSLGLLLISFLFIFEVIRF